MTAVPMMSVVSCSSTYTVVSSVWVVVPFTGYIASINVSMSTFTSVEILNAGVIESVYSAS